MTALLRRSASRRLGGGGAAPRPRARGIRCWVVWALFAACLGAGCTRDRDQKASAPQGTLAFEREGQSSGSLSVAAVLQRLKTFEVDTWDPYYKADKRFLAVAAPALIALAFDVSEGELKTGTFVFRAADGYAVTVEGKRLIEDGGFVAFDDLDVPGFSPIGPRQVSPAPAYLVWRGKARKNLETHPRPWQITTVDWVSPAALYPHTRPEGVEADSAAARGHAVFLERCIRCHAINREGGKLGPDLNVPQSIVDYRPEAQIRAYVKNPLTFRYGSMPANPDLKPSDLDALLAYFRVMSKQPHDPTREP